MLVLSMDIMHQIGIYMKDSEINNIAAYAGSKGGLIQMTKWLSTTLALKLE